MFKKILSALLAVTTLCSLSGLSALAVETDTETAYTPQISTDTSDSSETAIEKPIFYDENGKEVELSALSNDVKVNALNLPSTYDLRDEKRVTSVKNQESEGLCWDFASTSSFESSILSQKNLRDLLGENPEQKLDLSEGGNSWYFHTNIGNENSDIYNQFHYDPDKGTKGAQPYYVAESLASGFGAYPEELLPYNQYRNGYSETLRFYSDYRLKQCELIPDDDINLIKQKVIDNGGVAVRYNCFHSNTYIVDGMQGYYDNGTAISSSEDDLGHAVTIIGWDDEYNKDNFNPEMQPSSNGAWLCKNSWGTDCCSTAENYEGLFWLSYESNDLYFTQLIAQSSDNLENIHQYQVESELYEYTSLAANVFTAKADETLQQISYEAYTKGDVTAEVYKLNNNFSSPTDGTLLTSMTYKNDLAGIFTIECEDKVELKKGDTFSVVIKDDNTMGIRFGSRNVEPVRNRSFFMNDNKITDVQDSYIGYASIKAYTKNTNDTDKTELKNLIDTAEALTISDDISEEIKTELSQRISNAKAVVNDSSANQIKVNNTYYILNNSIDKINSYIFEINSVDDYNRLAELTKSLNSLKFSIVKLNTDLDFKGESIASLFTENAFSGTIDGNNHTIKNAVIDSTENYGIESSPQYNAIINSIKNATVKNITIDNVVSRGYEHQGVLLSKAENSTITNCKVLNSTVTSLTYNSAFFVSYAIDCTINNCYAENSTSLATGTGAFLVGIDSNNTVTNNSSTNCFAQGFTSVADMDLNSLYIRTAGTAPGYAKATLDNNTFYFKIFAGELLDMQCSNVTVNKVGDKYIATDVNTFSYIELEYNPNDYGLGFNANIENDEISIGVISASNPDVVIPKELYGKKITEIASNVYVDNKDQIKSITIEAEIDRINKNLFSNLPNLQSVKLDNIKEIEDFAFANCPVLETVDFGKKLTKINTNAFFGCVKLGSITLPETVTYIDYLAFGKCGAKSVMILSKNIEYIDLYAFGHTDHEVGNKPLFIPDFVVNAYDSEFMKDYISKTGFKFVDLANSEPVIPEGLFDYSVFIKGDVNLDGLVTVKDVTLLQEYLAGLCKLTDIQCANAQVGNEYNVKINNVTIIQKYIVGILDSLESTAQG